MGATLSMWLHHAPPLLIRALFLAGTLAIFPAISRPAPQDLPTGKGLIRRGPAPKSERHVEAQGPLLTFNLVALDATGKPFLGLRDVDIDIRDDGKPMHVVFCRPVESADLQSRPGPVEYSNRLMSDKPSSTLILLDLLNANVTERGSSWNDVVNTLRKLEPGQRLYLYLLTQEGTLYPVRALPDAMRPSPPDDDAWVTNVGALLDDAMHAVNRLRSLNLQNDLDARMQATLTLLRDLGSDFAPQPGRKSLVWISHGVPIGGRAANTQWHDYTPSVLRLGSDLARSGIAVYTVAEETDRVNPSLGSLEMLQQLAGHTGGEWLPNGATEQAIRQAVSEGRAVYLVGYRPSLDRWDDKFHKLRITAEGKGGIKLRVRSVPGYFGDKAEADPWHRFAVAATGQNDASEIGIRATAAPSEKWKGWIHLQINVDLADLHLTQSEPYTGRFLVAFGYYTGGWQADLTEGIPTDLRLTAAERDVRMREGILLSFDRPVRSGASKIRIVVRDPAGGAVGSLTVPLAAPSVQ